MYANTIQYNTMLLSLRCASHNFVILAHFYLDSELYYGQKEHKKKVYKLKQRASANDKPFKETEIGAISLKLQTLFQMKKNNKE